MKTVVAALILLLPTSPASAVDLVKAKYCMDIVSLQGRKARIQNLYDAYARSNDDLYRTNKIEDGGYFNMGLCWWNSRFQRAALYLAYFNPTKRKPTREEAILLIDRIAHRSSPVEIPGYDNLYDFTSDFKNEIRDELSAWQRRDTIRGAMRTLNPLRPTFYRTSHSLFEYAATAHKMLVDHGAVPYVMMQLKGVKAHSALILNVVPEIEKKPSFFGKQIKSYRLIWEDASGMAEFTDIYPGDTQITSTHSLFDPGKTYSTMIEKPFPIYIDWLRDFDSIEKSVKKYCNREFYPPLYPSWADWGTY